MPHSAAADPNLLARSCPRVLSFRSRNDIPSSVCPVYPVRSRGNPDLSVPGMGVILSPRSEATGAGTLSCDVLPGHSAILLAGVCFARAHCGARLDQDRVLLTEIHLALLRMCDIGMLLRASGTLHASEEQELACALSPSLTHNVAGGRARTPKGAWLSLRPRCRYSNEALRARERGCGDPCSSQVLAGVSRLFRM